MQTLSNSTIALAGAGQPAAFLVRRRFWIYLALFLVATALVVAERHRPASGRTLVAQARVESPASAPAETPDDRPLLLPDR